MTDFDTQIDELEKQQKDLRYKLEQLYSRQEKEKLKELKKIVIGKWFKEVNESKAEVIGGDGATYYKVRKILSLYKQYDSNNRVSYIPYCECLEVNVEADCFIGHCRVEKKEIYYKEFAEVTQNEVIKAIEKKRISQEKLYDNMVKKVKKEK